MSKARVTRLFKGGDGRWVYTAETLKGVQSQSLLRSDDQDFPMERVKKWISEGKLISWISYGDKTWVVVANRMDSDIPSPKQNLYVGVHFPEDQIKEAWKQNYKISFINYGDRQWVLVTEENPDPVVGQTLCTFDDIDEVKSEIQRWWPKNKAVHFLVYADKKWVMISQQLDKVPGQSFTLNSDWPLDKISEHFKASKYITSLAYNTDEEFWVIVVTPLQGGQSMATTETFPYDKIKKLENIYLYGLRE